MSSLTVRNLPDDAKQRFREVAAAHGRSMEEHLRQLIIEAGDAGTAGLRDAAPGFRHDRADPRAASRARIERLIELGRGSDWEPPARAVGAIKDSGFA